MSEVLEQPTVKLMRCHIDQAPSFGRGGSDVGELDLFELAINNAQIRLWLVRAGDVLTEESNR